jgi:hypothetical protein
MTEDVPQFPLPPDRDDREQAPTLPRPSGWHLCDDDLSVIDALHAVCVEWLTFARDAKGARNIAAMLEALEEIAAGRPVASMIEVSASCKPNRGDGVMATIQLTPTSIELSTTAWVWMNPEQGHDHAWTQRAELTPHGRFAYEDVDHWLYLSGSAVEGDRAELITAQSSSSTKMENSA